MKLPIYQENAKAKTITKKSYQQARIAQTKISLFLLTIIFVIGSMALTGCSDTPLMGNEEESEDSTPPTVESSDPSGNSYDVSLDTEVTVDFNEDIDENSVNISFYNPSTNASVKGSMSVSGSTLTFTPNESFRPGSSYELLVFEADDLAGNSLEEVYSVVFHTEDNS